MSSDNFAAEYRYLKTLSYWILTGLTSIDPQILE